MKMAKKPRILTDSKIKKEQSIAVFEREALIEERKKHQRSYKMRSDETKIEVVKTYLALGGNLALTASVTEISKDTLKVWKASAWWSNLVNEIKKCEKLELSAKTKRILDASMNVLADRVSNGDFIYDQKQGTLIRKPISAKDAHSISVDLIDRVQILDKETQDEPENKDKDLARLEALADKFAKIANKIDLKPVVNVTDVVFVEQGEQNAENEEREEGLQPAEGI